MKLIQTQQKQDDKVSQANFKRSPNSKGRVSLTYSKVVFIYLAYPRRQCITVVNLPF